MPCADAACAARAACVRREVSSALVATDLAGASTLVVQTNVWPSQLGLDLQLPAAEIGCAIRFLFRDSPRLAQQVAALRPPGAFFAVHLRHSDEEAGFAPWVVCFGPKPGRSFMAERAAPQRLSSTRS